MCLYSGPLDSLIRVYWTIFISRRNRRYVSDAPPGTFSHISVTSRPHSCLYQYSVVPVSPSPIDEKFVIFTFPSGKQATMSRVPPPMASIVARSVEI